MSEFYASVVLDHADPCFPHPHLLEKKPHTVFVPVHASGKNNAGYLIIHEKCYSAYVLEKFSTSLKQISENQWEPL